MEKTIANFRFYYEQKHGKDAFDKLYNKVINSNSLAKLFGLSISQKRPPTAHDLRVLGSNLFIMGNVEKITFASLIMLWDWNVKVNKVYNLATKETVDGICRNIIAQSKLTHF